MIKKINQNRTKKESKKPFKVAKIVLSSGDRALPPEWVDKVEEVQQATVMSWWDDKLSGGEEFLDLTNPIWRLRFSLQIFRSQSQDEKIR